jgi:hypothetical protein
MPKTGPKLGSRKAAMVCRPILFKASVSPMLMVVLPSPAGVGVVADTKINLEACILSSWIRESGSLAL